MGTFSSRHPQHNSWCRIRFVTIRSALSVKRLTHQVHYALRLCLPISGNFARNPIFIEINMDHLFTLPGRVGEEVIVRGDPHSTLGRCEYRLQISLNVIRIWVRRTFGRSPVCGTWCIPRLNQSTLSHQHHRGMNQYLQVFLDQ